MSEGERKGWKAVSRRRFIRALGSTGLSSIVSPALFSQTNPSWPPAASLPAFEEIPPSRSAITWTHVAGFSANMNEPETMGAGCAFLDYDNDGWMDIYLVNS